MPPTYICAVCSRQRMAAKSSLPQGQATCQDCRRARREAQAEEKRKAKEQRLRDQAAAADDVLADLVATGGHPDREAALRLKASGLSYIQVGAELGLPWRTIYDWVNPGSSKRWQKKNTKRKALAYRALRDKEAQEQRERTIREAKGTDLGEAYASLRRTAVRLDRVHATTDNQDQRRAIRDAITAVHTAEDALVKALRTPT